MKLRNIIGVVLVTALFTSCNKYLDVEPKGIVIPKKFQEYDAIFNSFTNTNSYPDALSYASDDVTDSYLSTNTISAIANAYFWNRNLNTNNDDIPVIWGDFYRQIYNTNIVINNIESVSDASEVQKKQLLGEALAERAYAHFNLLTVFAKAYNPQTAGDLPGVPWVTYTDVTTKTPGRSTLQATLNLIIEDLKTAESLMGSTRLNKLRMNKAVVQAVLSRVYLYMGKYSEAKQYASLALQEPHEIFNYAELDYLPNQMVNPEILLLKSTQDPSLFYMLYYNRDLVSLFSEDDYRRSVYMNDYSIYGYPEGTYGRIENYWGMYGIRFSELLLTQMEALAQEDRLSEALDLLNDFKTLRIANYTPIASSSKVEVLKLILEERRRELAFGSSRWFDMKRLAAIGLGVQSTRYAEEEALTSIDPKTYSYTFEIPSRVLMFNPDMPKNF